MNELLYTIVSELVNDKSAIKITEKEPNEEGIIVYEISVAEEDTGRVIGKQGKTVKAIRALVRVAAFKKGLKVAVEIV